MLGILLDVVTIIFFIYMFKKCSVKSKLQNAVESMAYIISAVVSVPIAVFIADFCYTSFFRTAIINRVESLVKTSNEVDASVNTVERIMTGMPTIVNNGTKIYKTTSGDNLAEIKKLLSGDLSSVSGDIVDIIARPIIDGILRALFFVVIFAACYKLFKAFYPTVEAYFYTPDRAAVSPVIGMVLGAGKVMVVSLIVISMIELVGAILPDIYIFRPKNYNCSFLFKLFCKDNLLMMFLGKDIFPIFN